MGYLKHEEFKAVFLNSNNQIVLTLGNYYDSLSFAELYQQVTTSYPNISTIFTDSGYQTSAIAKLTIDDNRTQIFADKRPMIKIFFF